jgi:hypothetical protein
LQGKWNFSSPVTEDDQVLDILSSFAKLSFAQRHAYSLKVKEQKVLTMADLPQGDQDLLARVRTPQERHAGNMIWLRTCYREGSDAALLRLSVLGAIRPTYHFSRT